MEVQVKKIKEDFSVSGLTENYHEVISKTNKAINKKGWEIKVDGEIVTNINLDPDFKNLSLCGRKKIAKKLHFINKKNKLRTINALFSYLNRCGAINKRVFVAISKKERTIQVKRKFWVNLRNQGDVALVEYKKEKGNFYKKT